MAQERSHREGFENLVGPASSHTLVSKPFLKRSRARFLEMEPGDSSMAHEWARLVHEWARLVHEWARLAHECPSPVSSCGRGVPSVFDRRHRSIHQMSRFMPSIRRHRTLRRSTLRAQVGRAAKVQHPIVTNSCNDYS